MFVISNQRNTAMNVSAHDAALDAARDARAAYDAALDALNAARDARDAS